MNETNIPAMTELSRCLMKNTTTTEQMEKLAIRLLASVLMTTASHASLDDTINKLTNCVNNLKKEGN